MEFESDGDRVVGKRSEKDVPRNMQEIIDGVYFPRTLSWCGVCSCLEGTENEQLKRNTKRTKCEALDDISGIILGCSAECVPKETRSSSGHKFKVLCRTHLKRLQGHMCCPFCDVFCTQGTFLVCSCGNEGFHFFHAACALKFHHDVKDDVRCPHCGHQPKEEGFDEWSSRIATDSLSEDCKNRLIHVNFLKSDRRRNWRKKKREEDVKRHPSEVFPMEPSDLARCERELEIVRRKSMNTPKIDLYEACEKDDIRSVFILLKMRVCQVNEVFQNRGNRRPVHAAAIHGNLALLNILHHLGADLNVRDSKLMTPMMYAAEKNHYEVVVFLMKNNCSPYLKNEDGKTALACAAKSGSLAASKAIIELTLKPRPLMDVVDRGGWTAMVWAAEFGSFPVVKYLLSHGADWRIKDLDGNMILHWSAYGGNKDIMEALLNVGCPLDLQNNDGDTALHIGARRKTVDCVNLLLRHGASLSVKNKAGHTPRHAAALVSDSIRDLLGLSEVINSDAIDVRKTEYGKNVLSGVHRPVSTVPEAAVKSFVDTDVSRGLERFRVPWFNSVDNEKFPVDSFTYIADNSSAFPMDTKIASTVNMKCNCSGMCDDRCACVVEIKEVDGEEATRYTYCMNGLCTPEVLRDYPSSYIVECGTSCGCNPMFCNNHVTQQGLGIMVQIFKTSTRRRGWGLRSIEDVKQRQFVCQYAGEWITRTEAVRRNDMSYTLEFHVEDALLLDAKYSGNVGRFINHSCKPNLALIRVMKDKREHRFPRACLFALRDISAGEELTLNYGEQFWKSVPYSCRCREVDCVAPPPTCSPVKVKSQLLKPKAKKMKPSLGSADICMG